MRAIANRVMAPKQNLHPNRAQSNLVPVLEFRIQWRRPRIDDSIAHRIVQPDTSAPMDSPRETTSWVPAPRFVNVLLRKNRPGRNVRSRFPVVEASALFRRGCVQGTWETVRKFGEKLLRPICHQAIDSPTLQVDRHVNFGLKFAD